MNYNAHESAIIDPGAIVGEGTRIWHWSHICAGANIGRNCSLGQNTYVANQVIIGNNCKIQNNVSLFDGVILEEDVFCGPSVVFTNVLNPRSAIPRKLEYRSTLVKKGATIGANATIVCGVVLGEYSFIAAGSVVTGDVAPYALMVGVPARQDGWMNMNGERINAPPSS